MKNIFLMILFVFGSMFFSTVNAQTYNAKTYFFSKTDINAAVSERVKKIHVKVGQRVKTGDLLVELNDALLKQSYQIAQAKVAEIEPDYNMADMDYERAQELYDRTLLSDVDLKKAEFAFLKSKAQLDRARAEAVRAKILLDATKITAPHNGRILSINMSEGYYYSLISETKPILTLIDNQHTYVKANLKTSEWQSSLLGKQVLVSVNDKNYKGYIESVSINPVKTTKGVNLYPYIVRFSSRHFYPAGIPATVTIP